uniref:DUF3511 domain protein n=1 Tax=Kalanchoe fedtschenkoi TaxID=63787 RepID=A0A7N0U7W9_KALFE
MDAVQSTYRSYTGGGGGGGRSLEIVTTNPNPYRPSNDLFNHPPRHHLHLDAALPSPRSRPQPTPRKSKKHHQVVSSSSSSSAAPSSASWWSSPEMKRKRRVVKYKMYAAEGKMKSTVRNGFRWIKRKCKKIVLGINV